MNVLIPLRAAKLGCWASHVAGVGCCRVLDAARAVSTSQVGEAQREGEEMAENGKGRQIDAGGMITAEGNSDGGLVRRRWCTASSSIRRLVPTFAGGLLGLGLLWIRAHDEQHLFRPDEERAWLLGRDPLSGEAAAAEGTCAPRAGVAEAQGAETPFRQTVCDTTDTSEAHLAHLSRLWPGRRRARHREVEVAHAVARSGRESLDPEPVQVLDLDADPLPLGVLQRAEVLCVGAEASASAGKSNNARDTDVQAHAPSAKRHVLVRDLDLGRLDGDRHRGRALARRRVERMRGVRAERRRVRTNTAGGATMSSR